MQITIPSGTAFLPGRDRKLQRGSWQIVGVLIGGIALLSMWWLHDHPFQPPSPPQTVASCDALFASCISNSITAGGANLQANKDECARGNRCCLAKVGGWAPNANDKCNTSVNPNNGGSSGTP